MDRTDSQYIIVGGSAAGMAAAHTIRRHDPAAPVTIFTEEPDQPYFRPMIPYVISGKKQAGDLAMAGCGPYAGKNIRVETNSRVVGVDTASHAVSLEDSRVVKYGKVLFATGSRPFIPPELKGVTADGVFALRTLSHAEEMRDRARHARHAVLLGGGLLNLKAAFALLGRGLKVTLVVYSPEVLSQLMDPEDALLIRKALDDAGLEIRTGASAVEIESDGSGVTGVLLDDNSRVSCQMVCIGKGVRPNVEFLKSSGIRLDKGIVADRHTACSEADTFAAGDAAVTHDPVTGDPVMTALWTNAVEMGRCAGLNMAGRPTAYTGTFGVLNATQIADMPFVSMGTVHTRDLDCEVHQTVSGGAYRKMVFSPDGSRLAGMVLIGDISNAGLYRHVIQEGMPVNKIKREIIGHRLHWGHFLK